MDIPTLESEIEGIQDQAIKTLVREVLKRVPEYNWTLPSSSSGKYHPPRDRAAYGNTYHTKEVYKFALVIADSKNYLDLDKVRCASILHDCAKYSLGKEHTPYTIKEHPDMAADLIMDVNFESLCASKEICFEIAQAVRSHMGRWGKVKPESELDWIIHLADNVASHNY